MDRELEVIRDEMEQTRANLADKLGALETQVRETVSTASESVTSTVEGVKEVVDTVSDTVESVTETINIPKQIEENPWLAIGIALAAGCAAGYLLSGQTQPTPPPPPEPTPTPPPTSPLPEPIPQPQPPAPKPPVAGESGFTAQAESFLPDLESMLPNIKEIGNTVVTGLGGLAVGSVMGAVRELVVTGLRDDWKDEVTQLVDQVTRQLGGTPLSSHAESEPDDSKPHEAESSTPDSEDRSRKRRNTRNQPAHQG